MATIPQFVPKFSTPQTTEMMRGISENEAPYPKPTRAVVAWKVAGWESGRGVARKRYPRDRMRAEGRRRVRRERVGRVEVDWADAEALGCWGWMEEVVGAKRSERNPVRRRATVDVRAMIVT